MGYLGLQTFIKLFPLGMYSVATATMIEANGLPFGGWIPAGVLSGPA